MPENHWYIERENEVLVDLDSGRRSRCLVRARVLPLVTGFAIQPSRAPGHYHVLVTLSAPAPWSLRRGYSLWLGSDPIHVGHDLVRAGLDVPNPALLICAGVFSVVGREPDRRCHCPSHKLVSEMRGCPWGALLRPHELPTFYGDAGGWDS